MNEDCPFCEPEFLARAAAERDDCVAVWLEDDGPPGSAMILPRAHRETVFDLTPAEWAETRELLADMRALVTAGLSPDGWNVGWNVSPVGGQLIPHAHCHLVPRWADELHAGKGLRWWIKQPDNRRPLR